MEGLLTPQFIISQILILIAYVFFALTYFTKGYRIRLISMIICNVFMIGSYALLNAWTAVPVLAVAIIRDVVSFANTHRLLKSPVKKSEPNAWLLVLWLVALTVATIFTQEGVWSLFIYFAVMTFTISSWQKSPLVYRVMGVFASWFVIIYNIAVTNVTGIALESIALVFIVIGLIRFIVKNRKTKKNKRKAKK